MCIKINIYKIKNRILFHKLPVTAYDLPRGGPVCWSSGLVVQLF